MTDAPETNDPVGTTAPDEQGGGAAQKVLRRTLPLFALAIVVAGLFLYLRNLESAPTPETTRGPQQALPVTVFTVQREDLPVRRRFLGRTEASKVVEIRARVAGYLHERTFEEGSYVEQGQPLFQIDPRPFENDLSRARAHLQSAEATLARANAQVTRYEELKARSSATAGELEEWQRQQGVAEADVALARAEIASAELDLEYTKITAPVSGMIGEALKDVGSYVDAGSNGLMAVISQVDPLDVRFSYTEKQMLRWQAQERAGQLRAPSIGDSEVSVTLADGSTWPQRGKVDFVDVGLESTTGTSALRAAVPNPARVLKPGQFVHVDMLDVTRIGAIRVPQKSVLMNASGASVYVVDQGGHVEVRPVVLGEWSGRDAWIVEQGLAPGDRVVTSRLLMLRPGMHVQIVEQ